MHLTEKQIALFLEKKLSSAEIREVKTHLAECSSCSQMLAEAYRLTDSFEKLSAPNTDKDILRQAEALVQNSKPIDKKLSFSKYAYAGFAVILIVLISFFLFNEEKQPSRFRSNDSGSISINLQPANESILTSSGLNFKWNTIPGSIAYRFLLFEETGARIGNFLVPDTMFVLPDSVKLESNTKYLWRIEIIYPDETLQKSDLNVFTYISSK